MSICESLQHSPRWFSFMIFTDLVIPSLVNRDWPGKPLEYCENDMWLPKLGHKRHFQLPICRLGSPLVMHDDIRAAQGTPHCKISGSLASEQHWFSRPVSKTPWEHILRPIQRQMSVSSKRLDDSSWETQSEPISWASPGFLSPWRL